MIGFGGRVLCRKRVDRARVQSARLPPSVYASLSNLVRSGNRGAAIEPAGNSGECHESGWVNTSGIRCKAVSSLISHKWALLTPPPSRNKVVRPDRWFRANPIRSLCKASIRSILGRGRPLPLRSLLFLGIPEIALNFRWTAKREQQASRAHRPITPATTAHLSILKWSPDDLLPTAGNGSSAGASTVESPSSETT